MLFNERHCDARYNYGSLIRSHIYLIKPCDFDDLAPLKLRPYGAIEIRLLLLLLLSDLERRDARAQVQHISACMPVRYRLTKKDQIRRGNTGMCYCGQRCTPPIDLFHAGPD